MLPKSSSMIGILVLTFAGLISGGCGGKGNDVKPGPKDGQASGDKGQGAQTGAQKPDFSLTAKELAKEYLAKPKETEKKYEGKMLEVTGEVTSVGDRFDGKEVLVHLKGAKKDPKEVVGTDLVCALKPEYNARGLRLSPGQKVQVTSKLVGFQSFFINMNDCTLKELGKSEIVEIGAPELVKEVTKDRQAAEKKYGDKWLIVCGEVADLTKDKRGFNYAKLKGDGKVVVSVTMAGEALSRLHKGQNVCLRGEALGGLGRDKNEVALQAGLIVEAKK